MCKSWVPRYFTCRIAISRFGMKISTNVTVILAAILTCSNNWNKVLIRNIYQNEVFHRGIAHGESLISILHGESRMESHFFVKLAKTQNA